MSNFLQKWLTPKPISKMEVRLHKNGSVEINVEKYLSSPEGQTALREAQQYWEQNLRM